MAEINFLPVCSNCKNIIYGRIDYEEEHKHIYPVACPYCGSLFETLSIPYIPFYNFENESPINKEIRFKNK